MKKTLSILFSFSFIAGIAQQPDNLKKGIDLLNQGENEKAIACFEKEIKAHPGSSEAWYYLGLTRNSTNLTAGFDEMTKAIELNPNYAEAYNIRAGIYGFQGETEKELEDYNNAVRSDPSNGGYYYNRATAHLVLGNYREAMYDCNKCIELEFDGIEFAYEVRASVKAKLGDFAGALADCNYLIELSEGENLEAYGTRGDVKFAMMDYNGAIADFLISAQSDMDGGYSLYKIGEVKQAMNDPKGACEMFVRAQQQGFEVDEELLKNCK
jgi:tetratricopeptide (TPR) repeat protein